MKKLEEIPKENIYQVPEKYFDELPGIIQARTSGPGARVTSPYLTFSLRYALPALALTLLLVFWFNRPRPDSPHGHAEDMLAAIDSESLVAYLEDNGITTEELLEEVDLSQHELIEIENTVYDMGFDDSDIDALMNEYSYELNDL
jgi:hypothetical protein